MTRPLLTTAAAEVAVHVVDDSFLRPKPATLAADHFAGGLAPLPGEYRRIIAAVADRGAEGVLLGCTEIGLLVGSDDSPVPVFETTRLHGRRAVDIALSNPEGKAHP